MTEQEQAELLAEELRKQQSLREYDARLGTNKPTDVGPSLPAVDYNQGARQAMEAQQDAARQQREIEGEKASSLERFVNEPVKEIWRATPGLNYLAPAYSPSSAIPYAENGGPSTGGGESLASGLPKPPAEQPKPETPEDWMARMYKQLGGGVGAPTIKMNEYLKQGYNQQREAQSDMLPALQAEDATKAAARQGILDEGQKYVEGLKKLQAQQADLFANRRAQMAQDEARMREAETSYDPNRVLRNIGEQPVTSGVLAFTAGLVGSLKGAAGDMSPNEILGEVDRSVARDVDMQREHYKRMQAGIEHGRANFADAVKMGASEQEALGTAAIASMDQHRRALEFAEARITDANKKAAIKTAIGGLNVEQGKMQYQMDTHNASNALSASKANRDLKLQLMAMAASRNQANPEMIKQADAAYHSYTTNNQFMSAQKKSQALSNTLKAVGELTPDDLKKMWTDPLAGAISGALASREAKDAHDGKALGTVVSRALRMKFESEQDPRKLRLLNALQGFINFGIHDLHGATVSNQEAMRSELERSLSSPENFSNYLAQMADDTQAEMQVYRAAGMHNPELTKMIDASFMLPLQGIKNWRQQRSAQQAAEDMTRTPTVSSAEGGVR